MNVSMTPEEYEAFVALRAECERYADEFDATDKKKFPSRLHMCAHRFAYKTNNVKEWH